MVMWPARTVSLLSLLLAIAGCASQAQPVAGATSPAVQPGAPQPAPRPRAFVSPYSYEWFIRGELLAARGAYAQAAEAYRAALASADDDAYLLARLADALDRAGQRGEADEALQAALERDPQSEAAWLARGGIAARTGASAQAIEAYERAEAAAPGSARGPFALAALLAAKGNAERAAAVLQRFAARSGRSAPSALRAQLELARVRGDRAGLVQAARRWLDHAPRDPEAMRAVAAELLVAGDPALALRMLSALPARSAVDGPLLLDAQLALRADGAVEALLATTPAADLGGILRVAEAYVQIGQPQRALLALSERATAEEREPHRRSLVTARAMLAAGDAAGAAEAAATIPEGSAYRTAALEVIAGALRASGLPETGREIEGAR